MKNIIIIIVIIIVLTFVVMAYTGMIAPAPDDATQTDTKVPTVTPVPTQGTLVKGAYVYSDAELDAFDAMAVASGIATLTAAQMYAQLSPLALQILNLKVTTITKTLRSDSVGSNPVNKFGTAAPAQVSVAVTAVNGYLQQLVREKNAYYMSLYPTDPATADAYSGTVGMSASCKISRGVVYLKMGIIRKIAYAKGAVLLAYAAEKGVKTVSNIPSILTGGNYN